MGNDYGLQYFCRKLVKIIHDKPNKRDSILNETKSVQLEKMQRMDEWSETIRGMKIVTSLFEWNN